MTEEELDLLASAYVDGEATSEEVALVERDPALASRVEARVAEFRAIDEQLTSVPLPPVQLKEQQLAAALAEFDTVPRTTGNAPPTVNITTGAVPAAETAPDVGKVIDLADRSAKRESRRRRWFGDPGAVPSFVTAAAAVVLIGGGVVFAANQIGDGGDDSTETAAFDFEESDDADDAAEEAIEESGEESADAAQAMMAEEDAERVAGGADEAADEAMADDEEAMEEEEPAEDAAESAPAPTTTAAAGGDAESTTGGLFPNEPVMSFDQVPDADEAMLEMPERRSDVFRSLCADSLTLPNGSEVIAFAPIEIEGQAAELFVIVDGDGRESGLIVDGACGAMDG